MTGGGEKVQEEAGHMPRAPSVDDLFAPMGRLDMHSLERGGGGNEGRDASLSSSCAVSSNVRSRGAVNAMSPTDGECVFVLRLWCRGRMCVAFVGESLVTFRTRQEYRAVYNRTRTLVLILWVLFGRLHTCARGMRANLHILRSSGITFELLAICE